MLKMSQSLKGHGKYHRPVPWATELGLGSPWQSMWLCDLRHEPRDPADPPVTANTQKNHQKFSPCRVFIHGDYGYEMSSRVHVLAAQRTSKEMAEAHMNSENFTVFQVQPAGDYRLVTRTFSKLNWFPHSMKY